MPVFACLFHIKEKFTHSCSYTSKGKHSLLLCRRLLLFFGPFFSEPRKDTVSPEQAWRSSDHTQSRQRSLHDSLSFFLPLLPSYRRTRSHCFKWSPVQFRSFFIIALSHCSHISSSLRPAWPRQSRGCMPTVAYLNCHSSSGFCPSVCLKRLMWTVERMVT